MAMLLAFLRVTDFAVLLIAALGVRVEYSLNAIDQLTHFLVKLHQLYVFLENRNKELKKIRAAGVTRPFLFARTKYAFSSRDCEDETL